MFQLERGSSMEWVRGDVIGCGSFSTVSLAIPKKQNSQFPQIMAVKSAFAAQSDMVVREKMILEELGDSPQIIRCFGGDYSVEKGEKLYNLFLEYARDGTLADMMEKQSDRRLPESEVRRCTRSILEGIKYIHENGYVHCDLKLENILLCSSSEDSPNDLVKIADFGLARRVGEKKQRTGVEFRGTPLYMSPEAVAEGVLGAPADVWALGCMVVEMITGAPAWRCRPETGVLQLLMRIGVGDELPEIPGDLSPEGRDFLGKIFTKDPGNRWTAQMLLEHPFVACQFCENSSPSTSPRGPFDWMGDDERMQSPSITEVSSSVFETWSSSRLDFGSDASERLRQLATYRGPNWESTDSWINVR